MGDGLWLLPDVTRVTYVQDSSRKSEVWDLEHVEVELQDGGRTLKVWTVTKENMTV